jgi:outer membrane protein assembly factor BamB
MRRRVSTRLALVVSLLLALLLTACDSSPAPVMKTPTATAILASENLYTSCRDGVIHVLRARDGAPVTQLGDATGPTALAPALSDGVLYYGTGYGVEMSGDTALVARDITAKRDLWRTVIPGYAVALPVIQRDTVYVAANSLRNDAASAIVALDAHSGALRWRYESREGIIGSPAVSGDSVWATTWRGLRRSLLALRASDGTLLWRVPLVGDPSSAPVLAQGILYVSLFSGALYALRADTGATVWVYHTTSPIDTTPAVLDGVVYASARDGTLFALNAADGRHLWTHSSIAGHLGWGEILAQDQTLYAGAPDGLLYALDARTGATLRAYQLGDQPPIAEADTAFIIWTAPILRDDVLYIEHTFGDKRFAVVQLVGEVVAIDLDTGAARWTRTIMDANCSPLVIG